MLCCSSDCAARQTNRSQKINTAPAAFQSVAVSVCSDVYFCSHRCVNRAENCTHPETPVPLQQHRALGSLPGRTLPLAAPAPTDCPPKKPVLRFSPCWQRSWAQHKCFSLLGEQPLRELELWKWLSPLTVLEGPYKQRAFSSELNGVFCSRNNLRKIKTKLAGSIKA